MDIATSKDCSNVEKYIEREIKIRSIKLINSYLFFESDYDEIEQDLRIKAWKSLDSYKSEKASWKTYLNKVLDNRALQLIANQKVKFKRQRRTKSIDDMELRINNFPELFYVHSGKCFEDLHGSISKLSNDLQNICALLMEHNISETATILDISRGSLRNKINKIRREFSKK
jgi:DNA-directed RNA polymerase specialized sigma subunit, sigma24 homolog